MNEFSIVCRILGTLFQRSPDDALVKPLLDIIAQDKLKASWPLEQDDQWEKMAKAVDIKAITADYQSMFGSELTVPPFAHRYDEEITEAEIREFLTSRGMPLTDAPTDTFGALLLATSWLEDQAAEDETAAQTELLDSYILPWYGSFLGKVEAHATTPFYRILAQITRDAVIALRDELESEGDSE
ncbi:MULTISPECIES: molecular chaperone [Providencia]|uniref:TorD/DmsD family molecular chaperone n=1 Tax=Providencia TaxID=586 RepID=UPI0012B599BB|nr:MULTISPECIES: molecular chaperone [Providencia]MTC57330.1 molecular chaperone [Providencia rustigianii]